MYRAYDIHTGVTIGFYDTVEDLYVALGGNYPDEAFSWEYLPEVD